MYITKHSVINFTSQIIVLVFSLITSIVLARALGPQGKGVYFLVFMIATTSFNLVHSSIPVAGVYHLGIKKYRLEDFVINFIFLAIFLGIVGIALVFALFKFISLFLLQNVNPLYLKVALFFIPLNLLTVFLSWIFLGLNDIPKYNLINIIRVVSTTAFIVIVCLFWRNILFLIIANLSAYVVASITAFVLLSGYLKKGGRFNLHLIKDVLIYGWKGHLGEILFNLINRLDSYLVKFFLGATFLGFYSVSLIAENLWLISMAIGMALLPKVSSSLLKDKNKDTAAVCRHSVFLTFLAALVLFIIAKSLIEFFFGQPFLPAVQPLWILLPGIASLSVTKTLKQYLSGTGRPQIATYSAMVTIIVCIFLNIMLIPRMGISGAALATTCSYFIYAGIILMAFLRISGNRLTDTVIIKSQDLLIYKNFILNLYKSIQEAKIF
ncbi:MAG: oligosaccharide flippase family protein [Candidatus Aminicenantes bacterium]|nr:oligosaccharide flippase family protein [Candidatus Aminicenantes bacterium]